MQEDKAAERISGDQVDVSRRHQNRFRTACEEFPPTEFQTLQYFSLGCVDLSVCDKHVGLNHINAEIWKNSFPPDPLLTFAAGFTLISARWENKRITQFSPEGFLLSFECFHQGFTPVMFPTKYLCRRGFNSCRNGVRAPPQRRRRRRRPG